MIHDIGVVAPDKAVLNLFEQIRDETRIDFTAREGLLEDGVEVAHGLVKDGAKVLISRGETTKLIRASGISVPIVDIPLSVHDVIPLIDQARHYSDIIAVVGFGEVVQAAEVVVPILSVRLDIFRLTSAREIAEMAHKVKREGYSVIVGTPRAVEMAEGLGLRGFALRSNASTLLATLDEADKLAEVARRENRWRLRQQAIIDSTREIILFLDGQGRLMPSAQDSPLEPRISKLLFGSREADRPVCHKNILASIGRDEAWKGVLQDDGGQSYHCRVHPVHYDGQNFGAMLLLERSGTSTPATQREVFQKGLVARYTFDDIIHASQPMKQILAKAKSYAGVESNLLIVGESGTGKEMVAQSLHNASRRRHGPFVAINCAALPEQLLESELFGYQGGAFTGARREGRTGIFELANTGTIFLDEIGEMSLSMQAKLLRTVEERSIIRLGGDKIIPLDVWVICATNRDLGQLIQEKAFRRDLYFRINVLRVTLPPLRQRQECLGVLIRHFLREICDRLDWTPVEIHPQAVEVLRNYSFPGNVRELRSLLERLVVTCGGAVIAPEETRSQLEDWAQPGELSAAAPPREEPGSVLRREEMRLIRQVLEECGGNRTKAAKKLGISTATLWRRLNKTQED
ncbi:sigma 54-interacting transcriptional regulator [Desulfocurvus sp. DL9XJH121]